ncbi:hypothetical protein [Shimia biformata]|uniref:hypothetical protein n=1 Tax=Shimia biformata TaxID=1294299 RepID=UPI00194E4325|nr:hypothetical protein [Shimia biformata]
MNIRHFLRMARWGRNPPSEKRVALVFAVILICLGIFAVERFLGWPEALTPHGSPKGRIDR